MHKKWLIRTRSNHILGPVSKEKVMELYKNGSIKPDDEICSGNGYWFFIREVELVEKYLIGSATQSFNPISEAKDVITSNSAVIDEVSKDDITIVSGINLESLSKSQLDHSNSSDSIHQENSSDPQATEVPEIPEVPEKRNHPAASESAKKKTNLEPKLKVITNSNVKKSSVKSQNYLTYLSLIIFIILFLAIYFRKTILNNVFPQSGITREIDVNFISSAEAQSEMTNQKKNS